MCRVTSVSFALLCIITVCTAQVTVTLNLEELVKHGNSASCWILIANSYYDVTAWIPGHPNNRILEGCGKNATTLFNTVHVGHTQPQQLLPQYLLGPSGGTTTITGSTGTTPPAPTPSTTTTTPSAPPTTPTSSTTQVTLALVASHNTKADCWLLISGKIYDVTSFISKHPGGDEILRGCGKDATALFKANHDEDEVAKTLAVFFLGNLGAQVKNTAIAASKLLGIDLELSESHSETDDTDSPSEGDDDEESGDDDDSNKGLIAIPIIIVALLLLAIIAAIVMKKRKKRKMQQRGGYYPKPMGPVATAPYGQPVNKTVYPPVTTTAANSYPVYSHNSGYGGGYGGGGYDPDYSYAGYGDDYY